MGKRAVRHRALSLPYAPKARGKNEEKLSEPGSTILTIRSSYQGQGQGATRVTLPCIREEGGTLEPACG